MRKNNCSIALLDRYLINQLIPHLLFAIAICTILSELIGISFEQIKFVAMEGLPVGIMAQVHYLKLPAFLALSLPLSLLMATIITYSKLSARNEIVAMGSYGISLYRMVAPAMAIALSMAGLMFALNEFVVPPANYQAAIILEQEWQVDRTQLAKYNKREIVYQKFVDDGIKSSLKFLFFADHFDGQDMQGITFLEYQDSQLSRIITAKIGRWSVRQELWQLFDGHQEIIDADGFYTQTKDFDLLLLQLSRDIFDYANHHRDNREMSIFELYQRLNVILHTNNKKILRQLKIAIHERYALPFSCLIFALLGTGLGMKTGTKTKSNGMAIAGMTIFIYYSAQFIATALTSNGFLPLLLGVWLPNCIGLFLSIYFLKPV
ncbi:LptF/LptG family permease [Waterburya agarophytonicola K14]|uniref:LptF/LptG family permease n=1 Tax=Waterburya agarophytonicola KI4 TaxID=2874699 RepID=A0A964FEE0_9CYAN|nr:LptF/LptG family permease [Waterburya agarophytonicola]MCC0175767.1 LptF/LptG family permease [Waterburya agarophytonicola KI4]